MNDDHVVVVDASWYLPAMGRDPKEEYLEGHIPGAIFWDIDALSRHPSDLPHMLPDPAVAAAQIGNLGIANDDTVIVYDGSGTNLSAARIWWELRVFGHDDVAVLDGGLEKWRAEGRPMGAGNVRLPRTSFTVRFRPELVRSLDQVENALKGQSATVVDARSAARFEGREAEPRPGVRSGHIPGSRNVPFTSLVDGSATLLPPDELADRFRSAGVPLDRPLILACGSGVTACALALGLAVLDGAEHPVYDGSWAEWGSRADTPTERGPATSP